MTKLLYSVQAIEDVAMNYALRSLRSLEVLSSEFAEAEDKGDEGSNGHKDRQHGRTVVLSVRVGNSGSAWLPPG